MLQHYDFFLSPTGWMPRTGDIGFMSGCASVCPSRMRVVLRVHDSAQNVSHICTYLVPINCTIIVDVQHTFHFDFVTLTSFQIQDKLSFFGIFYIRRMVLCVHDSAQTTSHICIYLVPINCTIIVDVQHIPFILTLDLISDPGQGHTYLVCFCMLYLGCNAISC